MVTAEVSLKYVALSLFGTSKEDASSLAFAFHSAPAGIYKLAIELRLSQTAVDRIMSLAHPLPQLWATLCGGRMIPACKNTCEKDG